MRRLLALLCVFAFALPAHAQITSIGEAGGNHVVQEIYVGEAGGNHTTLNGYIGTAAGNKRFFSALSVTASPTSLSGVRGTGGLLVIGPTTATPVGGTGSYTYAWTTSGVTVNSPSSASTSFQTTVNCTTGNILDTGVLVVTDTGSGATATTSVPLTFDYSGAPC